MLFSPHYPRKDDATQVPQQFSPQKDGIATTPKNGTTANINTDKIVSDTTESPPGLTLPEQPLGQLTAQDGSSSYNFQVFAWLNEFQSQPRRNQTRFFQPDLDTPFVIDEGHLRSELQEIDRYLTYQAVLGDRVAYLKCDQCDSREIYDTLAKEKEGLAAENLKARKIYEDKVKVVNKAENAFRFFFPPQFQGNTIGKFWGALRQILTVSLFICPLFGGNSIFPPRHRYCDLFSLC